MSESQFNYTVIENLRDISNVNFLWNPMEQQMN